MSPWFLAFAKQLADSADPKTATRHLLRVERAMLIGAADAEGILNAVTGQPRGRATATLLREFFARHNMIAGGSENAVSIWRQQWLDRITPRMGNPVASYIDRLIHQQHRASLYGNPGLTDKTINYQLAILVHFAEHLATRGVADWATVTTVDVETYLVKDAVRRLTAIRAFFTFTRQRKITLVNPCKDVSIRQRRGYTGPLLTTDQQRDLLGRWQRQDIDPRERVVGLLCLLHAASNTEVRHLHVTDIADDRSTLRLGTRPHPTPVDPVTADALDACLNQRAAANTSNPYLLIAHQTRLHHKPCSIDFARSMLRRAGVTPQLLRATRLSDLTQRLDPRVVAEALGITHEAALHYVIGAVQREDIAFGGTWES